MDLENQYYNSKALKDDDPKAALDNFQKVTLILIFYQQFLSVITGLLLICFEHYFAISFSFLTLVLSF